MRAELAGLPLLRVYIDETGDRGFTPTASPVFGFAAVIVPDRYDAELRAAVQQLKSRFGLAPSSPLHWVDHLRPKHHGRRRYAASLLAKVPELRVIYCMLDKGSTPPHAGMRKSAQKTYSFMSRLLFERIARCAREWDGQRHRAIVKVSHVKGTDHSDTLRYVTQICPHLDQGTPWELVTSAIEVHGAAAYDGMQAADLFCGMFRAATTADEFGATSPSTYCSAPTRSTEAPAASFSGAESRSSAATAS